MSAKTEIRRKMSRKLKALSNREIQDHSATIRLALFELEVVKNAPSLMTYVSKANEVSTLEIIDEALAAGTRVAVPKSQSDGTLAWYQIDSRDELCAGTFGILEPTQEGKGIFLPSPRTPLLVPGLAFTKEGDRLGRGHGYFDRYLASHNGPKIGLAFETQIVRHLPTQKHDIPIDVIVTEKRIYIAKG